LAVFSFAIWFLYPFLTYKFFIYSVKELRPYSEIKPTYIENLLSPQKDWDEINIGELRFKLPLQKCVKVFDGNNFIVFKFESGVLSINEIAPTKEIIEILDEKKINYPVISYPQYLAIFKSTPSDISLFNTRSKNKQASANQILKVLRVPSVGLHEINIVNPDILKAICLKSEARKRGYTASVHIYSQNEAMSFHIMLMNYNDKDRLDTDLIKILGGLNVPNHPLDIEIVEKDIKEIIEKFNAKT